MDKAKVLDAYRRGFMTLRECGQILGMEESHLAGLLRLEAEKDASPPVERGYGG